MTHGPAQTFLESKYKIDVEKYPDCRPLIEKASRVIKLGKQPPITFGPGVNFAVRSKRPFKDYRSQLLGLYGDPYYATGICLHEAAHGLIMEENGEHNIRFCPPGILRREDGNLFPYGACVKCDPQPNLELTEELIFRKTKQLAAGGVVMKRYTGINEVSDAEDYAAFIKNCAMTPAHLLKEDPRLLWKQAQDAVGHWLDLRDTKTKVFEMASEYLGDLYH